MVLVTGGTGLVGSHLLYQLALQNEDIIALHRKSSDLSCVKKVFSYYSDNFEKLYSSIQWLEADINDVSTLSKAFKDVTFVYHCAALISFHASDYKKMRKINIEGTANIVNLCISYNVQKLCFVSSIAAIGKPISTGEITENTEWNVEDNNYGYAITKYGAEMEIWRASQEGVDMIIVNPGIILGPGYWQGGSGKLFYNIYNGFKFYTKGVTGFVGVNDVVSVMMKLMKSSIKNERYILVSKNDSFKNVFFDIAKGFNKKAPTIYATKFLSEIAWRFNWILHKLTGEMPLITKHSAEAAHNRYYYSNNKIKQAIGFEFESIRDAIYNTCNNYLKNV